MRLETPAEVSHAILWSCAGCGRLGGEEHCGLILCPCGVMTAIRSYPTGGYEYEFELPLHIFAMNHAASTLARHRVKAPT